MRELPQNPQKIPKSKRDHTHRYLTRPSRTILKWCTCETRCGQNGRGKLVARSAKSILSVIVTVPFPFVGGRNNQYYVVEKIRLDILEADVDVDDKE